MESNDGRRIPSAQKRKAEFTMEEEEVDQALTVLSPIITVTKDPSKICKTGRACVGKMDEPCTIFQLHGRNEVPFVKMWGWTNNIPLEFPNLKENLCMKTVIYEDGDDKKLPAVLDELLPFTESLLRLDKFMTSMDYTSIHVPFLVQIVAKKKADTIFIKPRDANKKIIESAAGAVFVIGNLLVTDGYAVCIVTLPMESVQIILDKVEVGDFLIINKATFRRTDLEQLNKKYRYPYNDFLVSVEIKIEKYSVRQLQHIPFRSQPKWKPKLPEFLFKSPQEKKLWTPKDFVPRRESAPVGYFDIIGVVNYVGRLERYEVYQSNVKYVDDTDTTAEPKPGIQRFFCAYRWITLIDKESEKGLPLKLLITKDNMDLQNLIVPGVVVIITNCRAFDENVSLLNISPSVCSQVYLNTNVETYFKLMPEHYMKLGVADVLSFRSYTAILNRDVDWGAGGCYNSGIPNEEVFFNQYKEWAQTQTSEEQRTSIIKSGVPTDYVFARRERILLMVKGKIVLVQKVTEKGSMYHMPTNAGRRLCLNVPVYGDFENFEKMKKLGHHFSHPKTCLCSKCQSKNWFTFPRKLSIKIPSNITRSRDLFKSLTTDMQHLCEPLLMPAVYPGGPNSEAPAIGKQPFLKTFDHYRISIQDEKTGDCYQTIWTTYAMDEMERRYKKALGKVVIAEISIFSSEPDVKKEVILRDFIVEEQFTRQEEEQYLIDEPPMPPLEKPISDQRDVVEIENKTNCPAPIQVQETVLSPTRDDKVDKTFNLIQTESNGRDDDGCESQLSFNPRVTSSPRMEEELFDSDDELQRLPLRRLISESDSDHESDVLFLRKLSQGSDSSNIIYKISEDVDDADEEKENRPSCRKKLDDAFIETEWMVDGSNVQNNADVEDGENDNTHFDDDVDVVEPSDASVQHNNRSCGVM